MDLIYKVFFPSLSTFETPPQPEAFHRSERAAGTFVRTVTLPIDVEHEQVQADYTNGLLVVTLPKAEQAKPKQIAVSVAG
jgi:HSP20 family protein